MSLRGAAPGGSAFHLLAKIVRIPNEIHVSKSTFARRSKSSHIVNLAEHRMAREWFSGSLIVSNHVGSIIFGKQVVVGYVWPPRRSDPSDRKILSPGWRYVVIFIVFSVENQVLQVYFQ